MDKASDLLEFFKLDAEFDVSRNCTRETTEIPDLSRPKSKVKVVRSWRRIKNVGSGSFGTVWLEALEDNPGEERVVKELVKSREACSSSSVEYSQEVIALACLSRYSNYFVHFYGWWQDTEKLYITMEYVELGDLAKYVTAPLKENDVQSIARQILEGLVVLHTQGWAHRDLKPQNVLVMAGPPEEWWVKISDFGISKRNRENETLLKTVVGTREFMAPEITLDVEKENTDSELDDYGYTVAVDIWSLGCVLFWLLTKEFAFPNRKMFVGYFRGRLDFPADTLKAHGVRKPSIDFIQGLLTPLPSARPTAISALGAPWIISVEQQSSGPPSIARLTIPSDIFELDAATSEVLPPPNLKASMTIVKEDISKASRGYQEHKQRSILSPFLPKAAKISAISANVTTFPPELASGSLYLAAQSPTHTELSSVLQGADSQDNNKINVQNLSTLRSPSLSKADSSTSLTSGEVESDIKGKVDIKGLSSELALGFSYFNDEDLVVANEPLRSILSHTNSNPDKLSSRSTQQDPSQDLPRAPEAWWSSLQKTYNSGQALHMNPFSTKTSRYVFGEPISASMDYARMETFITSQNGNNHHYGYIPLVVGKCWILFHERGGDVKNPFENKGILQKQSSKQPSKQPSKRIAVELADTLCSKHTKLLHLQRIFDTSPDYGKDFDWEGYTAHDGAALLLHYLDSLPDTIIPSRIDNFKLTELVTELVMKPRWLSNIENLRTIKRYQLLVHELPHDNFILLNFLLDHLSFLASQGSQRTTETIVRLAFIFQSYILSDSIAHLKYFLKTDFVVFLIENYSQIFEVVTGILTEDNVPRLLPTGLGLRGYVQTITRPSNWPYR